MLQWSSCLFATIVIHAYHRQCTAYHHVFLLLTVTSILFHCEHHPVVRWIDKFLAHLAYILVIFETPKAVDADGVRWLLVFPVVAACAWFGQSLFPNWGDQLHLVLHLTGVCGMHMFLIGLY